MTEGRLPVRPGSAGGRARQKSYPQNPAKDLLYLERESTADSLRSDPRFQDLTRRIGVPH